MSETSRLNPNSVVVRWLAQNGSRVWVPAIVFAELRYGVEKLPISRQRDLLDEWLAGLSRRFAPRIVSFDLAAAEAHGRLRARLKKIGRQMDAPDSYIAATAIATEAALATRNIKHFEHAGIELIDPWAE